MSSIRPDLQIRMVIAGAEPEQLNSALRAIKQAEDANIRILKNQGELQEAYRRTLALVDTLAAKGAKVAAADEYAKALSFLRQINSEISKLNQNPISLQEKIDARTAKGAFNQAGMLKDAGDYAGALNVLTNALKDVTAQSDAWYAVQKKIAAVQTLLAPPTQAQNEARLADQAAQQARLALSTKDYAAAQTILNDALAGMTPGGKAAIDTQIRLNQVMDQGAKAATAAETATVSMAVAQANEAKAAGNLILQQEILINALSMVAEGSQSAIRIQTELSRAMTGAGGAAAAEARQQAATADRLNSSLAQRALLEARVAQSAGNDGQALLILDKAMKSLVVDSDAYLRVQTRINQIQAAQGPGFSIGSVFSGIGEVFNTVNRTIVVGYIWLALIRTIGGGIESSILAPVNKVLEAVITTTDKFRQLEITFSGIVGSTGAARGLTGDIAKAGTGLPSTLLEQETALRGLAFTPAIAAVVQTEQGRVEKLREILTVLQGLAVINPEQGLFGAQFATREAMAGQLMSLRRRFNVSPDVIAASIGKTQSDLRADPELVIPALKAFVNAFVGPDAIAEFSKLLSVQGNLFKGNVERFLDIIGDAKVYDRVTNLLRGFNDSFTKAIDTKDPQLMQAADTIGEAIDRVIDAMLGGASAIIGGLTGKNVDLAKSLEKGDVGGLANVVADVINSLSKLSASIYLVAGDILGAVGKLISYIPGLRGTATSQETAAEIASQQENLNRLRRTEIALQSPSVQSGKFLYDPSQAADGGEGLVGSGESLLNRFIAGGKGGYDASELPKVQNEIAGAGKDIARLQQRLALQKIAEGVSDVVPPPSAPAAPRNPALELSKALLQGDNVIDQHLERVFATATGAGGGGHESSLTDKIAQFNASLLKAYDPSIPGSIGDMFARGTNFVGDNASAVSDGMAVSNASIMHALQRARTALIAEASKDLSKASPDTISRQGGELFNSLRDLSDVSGGAHMNAAYDRSGLSLLSTVPPNLEAGRYANILPTSEDMDKLIPLITKWAQTRVNLGQATAGELKDDLATFKSLSDRYGEADALKRFGDQNIRTIQDRLHEGSTDVVRAFGNGFLAQGQTAEGGVNSAINAASESLNTLDRKMKAIVSGPGALDQKIAVFQEAFAESFDPEASDSFPAFIQKANDANAAFAGKFTGIQGVLDQVYAKLDPANEQDAQLRRRIEDFKHVPQKLDDALSRLTDEGAAKANSIVTELLRGSTAGLTKQASLITSEIGKAEAALGQQEKELAKPGDLSDRIAEFNRKAGAVLDPSHAGSVPAILALASQQTDDLAGQLDEAKNGLQALAAQATGPGSEALVAEIDSLLQQPGILIKGLAELRKKVTDRLNDTMSMYYKELDQGTGSDSTLIRRVKEQFIPGFSRILDAAGGGAPLGANGPENRNGISPLGLLPDGASGPNILPRPQDLEALGTLANTYAEALVHAGTATADNRAEISNLLTALQAFYTNAQVQKALDIAPEAAQAAADRIKATLDRLQDTFRDRLSNLRSVTSQFEADISGSFRAGLADSLVASMNGASDQIRSIFANLGKAIEQALANAIIEATIIRGLLNPALNYAFYGAANPTTTNAAGQQVPVAGSLPTIGWTPGAVGGKAAGDMFSGSLRPIGAASGLLTKPGQLVQTVEDGLPEAIVPVGRGGIPVRWLGAPQQNQRPIEVTVITTLDPGDMVARGVAARPGVVINPVNADMKGRGVTARTVRTIAR